MTLLFTSMKRCRRVLGDTKRNLCTNLIPTYPIFMCVTGMCRNTLARNLSAAHFRGILTHMRMSFSHGSDVYLSFISSACQIHDRTIKGILKHTEGTGAAALLRPAVPYKASISRRSSLWYADMSSEVHVFILGSKGPIYAAANGAFAEFCIICSVCSVGVAAEHGSILLTSAKSIPVPWASVVTPAGGGGYREL